eukprot:GHVU01007269.1.p1 GENE.GHVU01007269.1~~GHVU01007269.1.p1  ORF type:complete len:132 (-),score=19.37 GHVU01007269.1:347-742(-)
MRYGRNSAADTSRRGPIRKIKKYHSFRQDNIKRHHRSQHRQEWASYSARYTKYRRDQGVKAKAKLHAELLHWFDATETVTTHLEKVDDDVVIEPELLAVARLLYDEPEESVDEEESSLDADSDIDIDEVER